MAWVLLPIAVICGLVGGIYFIFALVRRRRREPKKTQSRLCFERGNEYIEKGMIREARDCYEQALRTAPNETMVLYSMGNTYFHEGEFEAAIEWLQHAADAFLDWSTLSTDTATKAKFYYLIQDPHVDQGWQLILNTMIECDSRLGRPKGTSFTPRIREFEESRVSLYDDLSAAKEATQREILKNRQQLAETLRKMQENQRHRPNQEQSDDSGSSDDVFEP